MGHHPIDEHRDNEVADSDLLCCCAPNELSLAFKALGHPVRLMILKKLGAKHSHCCGDICSTLPLAQSTVSQHLKVLRDCGFIELETMGQQSRYRIIQGRVDWFLSGSDRFFKGLGDCDQQD